MTQQQLKKLILFLAFLFPGVGLNAGPYDTYQAARDFDMIVQACAVKPMHRIYLKKGEVLYRCSEGAYETHFSTDYSNYVSTNLEFHYHIDNGDMIPWEEE